MRILYILLVILNLQVLQAQDSIRISGQLENNSRFAVVVVEKFGVGSHHIAVMEIDKESGKFGISAPSDIEAGVYRLRYSQSGPNEFVDVIINGKEKQINFVLDVLPESGNRTPVFSHSHANQQWYQWQGYEKEALLRIGLMGQLLAGWPKTTDSIYQILDAARSSSMAAYESQRKKFIQNSDNDTWAKAMVQNRPQYFANPRDEWRLQDFYLRLQYWQGLQTNRPELINTPLFTEHIFNYLQYYMNPEMEFSEAEMNRGFKNSVDTIVARFSGNEITRDFAIRYLQMGFREIGLKEVLQYIDQTYAAGQCTEGMEDDALQQRLKGYEALKAGSPAIDIQWAGEDGSLASLYDLPAESILVVFWASWCHHCMEIMPELNDWAANRPQLQVLAVSLDQDAGAYLAAAQEFDNLLHYNDYQGWSSKPAMDYFVYGTPTFILIDNQKRIMAKYVSFQTLKSEMQ
jgi:thiol-disulfide isomerase/thioredoxin